MILPAFGALLIAFMPAQGDIAKRNIRNVALFVTVLTFLISIKIWIDFDPAQGAESIGISLFLSAPGEDKYRPLAKLNPAAGIFQRLAVYVHTAPDMSAQPQFWPRTGKTKV